MALTKHLIIARYNESLNWAYTRAELFETIFIFNKGHDIVVPPNVTNAELHSLPNVGREADTYFHFLTSFYRFIKTRPDDVFIFLQGNPFDVAPSILQDIEQLSETTSYPVGFSSYRGLDPLWPKATPRDRSHPNWLPVGNMINHLFYLPDGLHLSEKHEVVCNAQWAVRGSQITFRSQEFYEYCLSLFPHSIIPMEAFLFERLWQYVFNPQYLDWITHYTDIRRSFTTGVWRNLTIE